MSKSFQTHQSFWAPLGTICFFFFWATTDKLEFTDWTVSGPPDVRLQRNRDSPKYVRFTKFILKKCMGLNYDKTTFNFNTTGIHLGMTNV